MGLQTLPNLVHQLLTPSPPAAGTAATGGAGSELHTEGGGLDPDPDLAVGGSRCGLDPGTPAVAVERGTTSARRVVYSPLAELPGRVLRAGLKSPTLVVVGEVVGVCPGWAEWDALGRPTEHNVASSYPEVRCGAVSWGPASSILEVWGLVIWSCDQHCAGVGLIHVASTARGHGRSYTQV